MSVLIKGMEMPTNCDNCWALDDYGDYPRCRITEEQRGYNFPIREKRMDKCPLVEIPPHGRLIDADALEREIDKNISIYYQGNCGGYYLAEDAREEVEFAPTIIEAEEGET